VRLGVTDGVGGFGDELGDELGVEPPIAAKAAGTFIFPAPHP
jgi:hypothetical protein